MAVNASESIQTHRELTNLEGTTDSAGGGSGSVFNDLEEFEKSIHNSFNTLMEYRDAPPSPSTSSVTSVSASGLDGLSSPTTPASPIPEEMDDKRLPNELLEEICEDMGIKDSMDIDLIDYMMDQTSQMANVHDNYCNSIDMGHQIHRVPDMSMSMKSPMIPNISMPIGKENMQRMGNTPFQSMNNGGLLSCHMPGKMMNPGKSMQSFVGKAPGMSPPHVQSEQGFKAPCAPTQLTSSSVSLNANNKHTNYYQMPNSQQLNHNNCMHSYSSASSMTHSCCGGSHQHHPHCSNHSSEQSSFPTRTVTFADGPPNIINHNMASAKYHMGGIGNINHHHHNNNNNCSQSQNPGHTPSGKPDMYHQHNAAYAMQPQNKYGRPSPPVVNVQNMQHHMKMSGNHHSFNNSAKLSRPGCLHQSMRPMTNCGSAMFKYEEQQLAAVQKGNNGRTLESPLDQGYFSGDAASVKSYSSQSSVCQSNDMLSSQDSLTIKTEPSQQQQHPQQMMYNRSDLSGQVMVKTENMLPPGAINQNQREPISNMKQYSSQQQHQQINAVGNQGYMSCSKQGANQGNMQQYGFNMSTCTSDPSQKSVQSKILPRLTHSKDVAPYTVPSNNGQATINPYHEFTQGGPSTGQSGLDNAAAAVDFPTNFGKESLNTEHNQNHCQAVGTYGNQDYSGQANANCVMTNPDFPPPNSHSSNIPPQQSPNTSYNSYNSQSTDMGQSMQQTMVQSGAAYQGACLPKGMDGNRHSQNSSDHVGGYPGMTNQGLPSMKPFKQEPDNQVYNANKQSYMHDARMMSVQNQMPAQSWQHQHQHQQQQHGYPSMNMNNSPLMHQQNARYMCSRNSVRASSVPSQCIQASMSPHSFSNPNMSHNMEIRNRVMIDMPSNPMGPHSHQNALNGNMPPQVRPQGNWSMNMGGGGGAGGQVPQSVNPMQTVQLPPQAKIPNTGLQHMQFPPHPTGDPNCPVVSSNCKLTHRPSMLSSQEAFIEHLIMDKSSAYRSHPLFPLLRDLMITYMNFNSQSIHYQLIQHLPSEFERLLQNFLNRNPPRGDYQSNYAVESVIMDALRYAHTSLIEKIRSKQEQDKRIKGASQSITAIEEFCEKFDRSKHNPMESGACIHGNPATNGQPCGNQVFCRNAFLTDPTKGSRLPMEVRKACLSLLPGKSHIMSQTKDYVFYIEVLKEQPDSMSDNGSVVSSSSNHSTKSESKKHPSLPKEAVAIMLEWLRNHKDNPYPNDDEKAMLIKQTGLTINQINYWFTNARRRILPKWAQAQAQAQAQARSSTPTNSQVQLPAQTGQVQQQQQQQGQQQQPVSQQQQQQTGQPGSTSVTSTTLVGSAVSEVGSNISSCSNNNSSSSSSSSSNGSSSSNSNTNSSPRLSPSRQQQPPSQSSPKLVGAHSNTPTPPSSIGQSPISRISEQLSEVNEPSLSSVSVGSVATALTSDN